MYIGDVSKNTGLSVKTIRFYEERGLINPMRQGRYRVYSASDVEILNLIREAKALGATLSQLSNVIVYKEGEVDWLRIGVFLDELRQNLLEKISELQTKVQQIEQCQEAIRNTAPKKA